MIEIKLSRLWWLCIVALAVSYPMSVAAASRVFEGRDFTAPFLFSWLGVWVFSLGGGLCASFVRIPDIDAHFYAPMAAKFFLGLFSGVALCSLIDGFTDTQSGALTFFAFLASLFSAPIGGGIQVWLSNQKRIDSAMNRISRNTGNRYFPVDTEYKREVDDDAHLR